MSRDAHSTGPVPAFAKPLTPYIKPRDETLRIRQALALYLRAQIEFQNDTPQSHVSLCAFHNVTSAKRVPPELGNGLRAQYLKALQANIIARKEHGELLNDVKTLSEQLSGCSTREQQGTRGRELQTYLSLLQGRQQKKKAQICHHYLEKLNSRDEARVDYLDMEKEIQNISVAFQALAINDKGPGNSGNHPDTMLHELERAVILTKAQAENEKRAFEELKAQSSVLRTEERGISPNAKLNALMRTRDELVQWIEHTLASTGMEDASLIEDDQDRGDADHADSRIIQERLKTEIEQQYEAYVSARRKLLEAASSIASSPLKSPTKPVPRKLQEQEPSRSSPDLTFVFPYAHENLSPLLKAQKSTTVHKSFLSAILSKERWNAGKALERLQNESHLLPEYPIPARQQRSQPAAAALHPRTGVGSSDLAQSGESEIVIHAEAWAYASNAAHNTTKDHVNRQLAIGTEMTRSAEKTLRDIYDTMNQEYDGNITQQGATKAIEEDIWTTDTGVSKNKRIAGGLARRPKGPWSGLNGKVGVIGE